MSEINPAVDSEYRSNEHSEELLPSPTHEAINAFSARIVEMTTDPDVNNSPQFYSDGNSKYSCDVITSPTRSINFVSQHDENGVVTHVFIKIKDSNPNNGVDNYLLTQYQIDNPGSDTSKITNRINLANEGEPKIDLPAAETLKANLTVDETAALNETLKNYSIVGKDEFQRLVEELEPALKQH